jgi:hypothetical protein
VIIDSTFSLQLTDTMNRIWAPVGMNATDPSTDDCYLTGNYNIFGRLVHKVSMDDVCGTMARVSLYRVMVKIMVT